MQGWHPQVVPVLSVQAEPPLSGLTESSSPSPSPSPGILSTAAAPPPRPQAQQGPTQTQFSQVLCSDFLLLQEGIHFCHSDRSVTKPSCSWHLTYRELILRTDDDEVKLPMVTGAACSLSVFVPFLSSTSFRNGCPVPLLSCGQEILTCSTGYT